MLASTPAAVGEDRHLSFLRSTAAISCHGYSASSMDGGDFCRQARFAGVHCVRHDASVEELVVELPRTAVLASVREDGKYSEVSVEMLQVGGVITLRSGAVCPVDGIVQGGRGYVSETHMNGEILPVPKGAEDMVLAGSSMDDGQLHLRIVRTGDDTWIQKALQAIFEAQDAKPRIQELADYIGGWFTSGVLSLAVITGAVWWWVNGEFDEDRVNRVVAVLLCACPCALGLSAPACMLIGTGKALHFFRPD
jgi:Cu+-exporting ATPase